jgi:hypothetical protein
MPKIRRPCDRKRETSPTPPVNGVANGQIDYVEDEKQPVHDELQNQLISLTRADKQNYMDELKRLQQSPSKKKYELVPIWTLEDVDGQPKGKFSESPETQGRYRKYAEQGTSRLR